MKRSPYKVLNRNIINKKKRRRRDNEWRPLTETVRYPIIPCLLSDQPRRKKKKKIKDLKLKLTIYFKLEPKGELKNSTLLKLKTLDLELEDNLWLFYRDLKL